MNTAPPRIVLATLAVLVSLMAGFVCVLYALTPAPERVELLGKLAPLIGGAVIGLPAVVAALSGQANRRQLDELQATTKRVEHQTNGELTARLHSVIAEHLDSRGLTVPEQRRRSTDLHITRASDGQPAAADGDRWWDTVTPAPVVAEPAADEPAEVG